MAEFSEKYATYGEVPVLRQRWFFVVALLLLTPLGVLIAITGNVYFPRDGRVAKMSDGGRIGLGLVFAVLIAWQLGRILVDPHGFLMAFDHTPTIHMPKFDSPAPPPPAVPPSRTSTPSSPTAASLAGAAHGASSLAGTGGAGATLRRAAPALVSLTPDSVTASSFYAKGGERHPPDDAFDGLLKTAWNEGAPGPGQGQWIEAHFNQPRRIRRIEISAGFDYVSPKYGDLFPVNAHLRAVRVLFDGGKAVTRAVPREEREITLDGLDVMASSVRVIAARVWEGTRWQDLAISEINIEGDRVP